MEPERERVAAVFGQQAAGWEQTALRLRWLAASEGDQRAVGLLEKAALEADQRARDWAVLAGRLRETQPEPAPEPEPVAEPGPPAPSRAEIPAWTDPDLRAEPGGR